jgi:hypothetical protein
MGQGCDVVRPALAFVALTLIVVGCGADPSGQAPTLSFGAMPFQTIVSSTGHLHVDVRWSPAVPVKGDNAAQLTFSDDLGNPVDGLSVTAVPWMPAHGHGTSIQPVTTTAAPAVIVAVPVYLFMSGEWQLRLTITGGTNDSAVASVEIP